MSPSRAALASGLAIFHHDPHPGMPTMFGSRPILFFYPVSVLKHAAIYFLVGLLFGGVHAHWASAQATGEFPKFAPGVLTTIPADVQEEEVDSVHDLVEIRANQKLDRSPNLTSKSRTLFEMAHNAHFRKSTWCLEFAFKPLRMLEVDVPQDSGKMQRKLIWYLVYRVRNTGVGLAPQVQENGTYKAISSSKEQLRMIPELVLVSLDQDRGGKRIFKAYLDRIIPAAIEPIAKREMSGGELLNSVEVSERILSLETGRQIQGIWGVATWEDVDPSIDYFSVFVGGLSNALQWHDPPGAFQVGDIPGKGRRFLHKSLQLNFWRPGDDLAENEREIRYGIPPGKSEFYDCEEGVAYRWVYR